MIKWETYRSESKMKKLIHIMTAAAKENTNFMEKGS